MDAPTIFDLIDTLAFMHGMPSVALLLGAAFIAVVAWDMRLSVGALLVHYLLAGYLFVDVLDPRLAVVYALAGIFVSAILLVTARQVNWGRPPSGAAVARDIRLGADGARSFGRLTFTNRRPVRLVAAVFVLLLTVYAVRSVGSSQTVVPPEVEFLLPAIYGLLGLGLVGLATSAEPLPSGIGLLIFFTGFALYFGFLDQSLAMTVALVVAQLVVSLAVAYLAQARHPTDDIPD